MVQKNLEKIKIFISGASAGGHLAAVTTLYVLIP